MGEICHNCKSEFTFFDGEVYQCINCSYMWVPEIPVKAFSLNSKERAKIKKELLSERYKEEK